MALTGLLLGALVLAIGCGDDSNPTTPGGGTDTTAPVVVGVDPAHHETNVAVDALVTITFNEDMDPASHAGQITLSSGTITAMTWTTARVLAVTHGGWDQGASVTVTIGTGLRDAAGNQLAAPVAVTFYTATPELVLLASSPADAAVGVNRSALIELLFSASMNVGSVAANLALRDASQADLAFTVRPGDGDWVVIDPEEALPAQTAITVTVGAAAQDIGGRQLGTAAVVTFTTGSDVDTTPPTIVSFTPASGGTIAAGTTALSITFSEPIDPSTLQPTEMGAELFWLVMAAASEPIWSQDNTVFTVALPAPLPAGMPLWVTFANYADANGVVQSTPSTWTVTVSGTADYYPLIDGRRAEFQVAWQEGTIGNDVPDDTGEYRNYVQFEAQDGGVFHRVEYDETYGQAWSWEIMDRSGTALRMHGFADAGDGGDPDVMLFSTPIDYLRLPPAASATWLVEAGVQGQPDVALVAQGAYVEQLDRMAAVPVKDSFPVYWTNVWVATLTYTMSVDGVEQTVGTDTMYLAPGMGLVRSQSIESYPVDDRWERHDRVLVLDVMR